MHAIQDGLDAALDNLDQVLKNEDGQVDLIFGLNLVHEQVINLAHCSLLRPCGSEKLRDKQMQEPLIEWTV